MYTSVRDRPAPDGLIASPGRSGASRVGRNVVFLGLTSLFTDISSEMVNAILPLYLILELGFTPLQFGLFDGAYQGVTALLRVGSGVMADRSRRHKEVAGFGYALSAVCKLGLLVSHTGMLITGILFADRVGKGIRTAPRDALISLSSRPERMAESFGVHRTLDTAGALAGPFAAFVLLGVIPGAYDTVFMTSFCVALIGLGVLVCFVRNHPRPALGVGPPPATMAAPSVRAALGLLRLPGFRRLVVVGAVLGAVTVSDAFLYLSLQHRIDMPSQPFPLLFVGTALVYLLLAVPLGRLADRVGRAPVFVVGHVLLVGAYAAVRSAGPGIGSLVLLLTLLGASYAATDGVLMAMTSSAVPERLRTSGLAVLTTVTVSARLAASISFGLLWSWGGPDRALTVFLVGLVLAIPATIGILFAPRKVLQA